MLLIQSNIYIYIVILVLYTIRAWLVWTPAGLKITKTIGADTPLTEAGSVPILTMDVWEHAYYLNYQNLRQTYEETYVDKLINWDFVNAQLPADAA